VGFISIKILKINNPLECEIKERVNRFVVKIIINGKNYVAWLNNTGKLKDFLQNGRMGFCVKNQIISKTSHRLFVIKTNSLGCLTDTLIQMKSVERLIEKQSIPWLGNCLIKRNPKLGTSVVDYLLRCKTRIVYLEVKSAVLKQNDVAMYPDCPSERGRKHVKDLIENVEKGGESVILFIAGLPYINSFKPNKKVDPEMHKLLIDASKKGVKIKSIGLFYNPKNSYVEMYNPNLHVVLNK